jgi:TPR repeat protein
MYDNGRGVAKNEIEAVQWYRKAAEQGNAVGQANLGYMYETGRGVIKDDAQAVQWYRRAADQGNARAQTNLGVMYENGRGVSKDDAQAVQWYRKAAEQGNAFAQNNLGYMYLNGHGGLPQDDKQAVEWFRKAADQGNARAQNGLGYMYEYGRGDLPKDDNQAALWYRKAAEQGHKAAQGNLDRMYREGRGKANAGTREGAVVEQEKPKNPEAKSLGDKPLPTEQQHEIAAPLGLRQGSDASDLTNTIAKLVKSNEKDLSGAPALDPERIQLARQVTDASGARETLVDAPEELDKQLAALVSKTPRNLSPQFVKAMGITLTASFDHDQILASFERKLAETVDAETLRVGLQWEGSDVARHMQRLDREGLTPEGRTAMQTYALGEISRGARTDNPRARACAQADTLADMTESLVPMFQAITAGVMIGGAQQQPAAMDMDGIRRAIVAARPVMREAAREAMLLRCIYVYRDLSDTEVEQWLEFLRSDSGGRYARGFNDAFRDAMLDRAEVFTRTLTEVARQIKGRSAS